MIFKCPRCMSTNIEGSAIVSIDFQPDSDGFDFDYQQIEGNISKQIDLNFNVAFICNDCGKHFDAKDVQKDDD